MVQNPSVQAKAQREIDSIVGIDRLLTHEDRESLPYLDALMKEVLRWGPVLPLSIPHNSKEEDVYEGMRIPKGATLWPNVRYACFGLC